MNGKKFSQRNDKTYAFIPRDVNFNGDKQTASNVWLWKDDYLAPLYKLDIVFMHKINK